MPPITIQVLEGLERGRCYDDLETPVTIGREEENTIRLNDERVSRFHAKLQEDAGRVILTDLDSTNGTRVNGRPVQMRVLKPGDQVSIGRCLLLFGSRDEIAARAEKGKADHHTLRTAQSAVGDDPDDSEEGSFVLSGVIPELPPDLPEGLTPSQRAELSDLLGHVHDEIRRVLLAAEETPTAGPGPTDMRVTGRGWQRLLRLEMDLSVALRRIADPDPDAGDAPTDH
jgi:hypothetical protein